ncbi:MAG: alanine:cation symporter family protein, partial [[Eubacterium] saphenum]|nr:alanine:cation symporter family protein [[Eubacterium] saphenum]
EGGKIVGAVIEPVSGSGLASIAFKSEFGEWAGGVLAVLVAMFAFSTVIGWSYFGSEAACYIFGNRIRKPFLVVFTAFSIIGATVNMQLAWGIADMLNGLMAIPNLFAVFALRKEVLAQLGK